MPGRNPDLNEMAQQAMAPASVSNQGGSAPQATSTIGTPVPPPQVIQATGNASATTNLNPFGPRNEMQQGAIMLDIPGSCYTTYVQRPTPIEVTDGSVPWSVIAQIPYDPMSDFMGKLCRTYASLHDRYNGSIMVQLSVQGNAIFSGSIIVGWVPKKLQKTIATPEDVQLIAYKIMAVNCNSIEEYVLNDARKSGYYREHGESVDDRPHLVICVHTPIQSALKPGIFVSIQVATRFAGQQDALKGASPFYLSLPRAEPYTPTSTSSVFSGRALKEIFPHMGLSGADYRMCVDGGATVQGTDFENAKGRHFRTFVSLVSTLDPYDERPCPIVQCQNNVFVFVYSDTTYTGIQDLVHNATDLKTQSIEDIITYLSEPSSFLTGLVARINKSVLSWSGGTIHAQIDVLAAIGRITAWVYQGTSDQKVVKFPVENDGDHYKYPYSSVLGVTNYSSGAISGLPLNWRNVTISSEPVTTVQAADVAPSTYMDSIIQQVIEGEAAKLPEGNVIQFDLQDPESRSRVATLRWSKKRNALVMSTADLTRFALYPSDVSQLVVGNWSSVVEASSFPLTTLTQWASRTPAQSQSTVGFRVRNAALAAELGEAVLADEMAAGIELTPIEGMDRLALPNDEDFETLISDFQTTLLE